MRHILAALFLLIAGPAFAQPIFPPVNVTDGTHSGYPTIVDFGNCTVSYSGPAAVVSCGTGTNNPGGSANSVQTNNGAGAFGGIGPGTNGQVLAGQTGASPAFETLSGDAVMTAAGVVTVTKTGGVTFGGAATQNTGTSGATIPLLNGVNTWGAKQTMPPPTTGGAGFAIPPGTAPTSPVNGDLWTTTTGLYAQINGATVGPLGTGNSGTPANPTATAGPTTVNGTATTYMRSDGAPAVQTATTGQLGLVKPDGTTITIASGVITAVGGSASSITPGTTTIIGATAPCALVNSTGTTSACAPAGAGIVISGSAINTTVVDTTHTASATTANIGGQDDYNGSSLTATLATLASGQTLAVTNQNASALTIALNSQTVNGAPLNTTLDQYGFCTYAYTAAATLNAACFPGFGTITSGALMKFNDATGAATAFAAGTGVLTAMGSATNASGGLITFNGALGTPTSGTLTNATGLPAAGVTGTAATLSGTQTYTGTNTFAAVQGGVNVQSGTTYTTAATDCGKTLLFTSNSAVTVTVAASIVPASGTACVIAVLQGGSAKVSVNGSAVTAATLISPDSFTGTSGTQGAIIDLVLTTVSAATNAYLSGRGS